MKEQIRVVSVDDHPLVREGIVTVVNAQPDMRLVAQASNGRRAHIPQKGHAKFLLSRDASLLLERHSEKEAAVVAGRALVERRQTIAVEMFGLPAVGEGAAEPVEVMADPVQNTTLANLLCNAN